MHSSSCKWRFGVNIDGWKARNFNQRTKTLTHSAKPFVPWMWTHPVMAALHREAQLPTLHHQRWASRLFPCRGSELDGNSQDGQQKRSLKSRTLQHPNPNGNARSKPAFNSLSIYQPTNSMAHQDHDVLSPPGNFTDVNRGGFELLAVIWKEWDINPD